MSNRDSNPRPFFAQAVSHFVSFTCRWQSAIRMRVWRVIERQLANVLNRRAIESTEASPKKFVFESGQIAFAKRVFARSPGKEEYVVGPRAGHV
jgi:hypothetical protein